MTRTSREQTSAEQDALVVNAIWAEERLPESSQVQDRVDARLHVRAVALRVVVQGVGGTAEFSTLSGAPVFTVAIGACAFLLAARAGTLVLQQAAITSVSLK
jgi:hypothetical protein